MKLSAYIVRSDTGFSPNPFGRVCTLACCKPAIRRNAEAGDIIIGTGSVRSGLSGHLIYAMRVGAVLPYETYWRRYPSKRPSPQTPATQRGDNIWHHDSFGNWCGVPDAMHGEQAQRRDVSGQNVLVSSEFYYFGGDAIRIPDEFRRVVATTQGHKNTYDLDLITRFWQWIEGTAPNRGRIGLPAGFAEAACSGSPRPTCRRSSAPCHKGNRRPRL
jgi:hypothetical protein